MELRIICFETIWENLPGGFYILAWALGLGPARGANIFEDIITLYSLRDTLTSPSERLCLCFVFTDFDVKFGHSRKAVVIINRRLILLFPDCRDFCAGRKWRIFSKQNNGGRCPAGGISEEMKKEMKLMFYRFL